MYEAHKTGATGEELAVQYLERKGYRILERNWRWRRCEIDIIALKKELLVIVEVKSRTNTSFGMPESFVTLAQWNNIAAAAGTYMAANGFDWEVRFDIVAITLTETYGCRIDHFRDVFFPNR